MVVSFGSKRSFLFLQGLATPFFVRLGREIASRGHAVHRINLCGGDRVFWPKLGAVDFRGRFSEWRKFLGIFLHNCAVTDIILFGDCRPYHRVAIELARSLARFAQDRPLMFIGGAFVLGVGLGRLLQGSEDQ